MPTGHNGPDRRAAEQEQYRRRQEAKAQKRKKRLQQRIILMVSLVVALALLIFCAVMIVRAVTGPKAPSSSSASSQSSSAPDAVSRPMAADTSVWNLVLFNNNNKMPDGFNTQLEAEQLLVPVDNVGHLFDSRAADKLKEMVAACNAVEGQSLAIVSGYRGPQTQDDRYNALVAQFKAEGQTDEEADRLAREIDPPFGYSDHQTALAVDFIAGDVTEAADSFGEMPEAGWLRVNASQYGFILRYPENKEAITGVKFKPYHYRYVGVEEAKAITAAGICLEEYLAQGGATAGGGSSSSQPDSSAG